MAIIPEHKSDFKACDNLAHASDEEVKNNLNELLQWLQDINWPVAPFVIDRIKSLGTSLTKPIKNILNGNDGNDGIWKYWIITNLLNLVSKEVLSELENEINRLVREPTENDKEEEVNIASQEHLDELYKNT